MVRTDIQKKMSENTPQKHGRKVLQELQRSIRDQNILVGSSTTVLLKHQSEKKALSMKVAVADILKEHASVPKENSPVPVRRSQRKRAEILSNEVPQSASQKPVGGKKASKKEKAPSKTSKKNATKTVGKAASKKVSVQEDVSQQSEVSSQAQNELSEELSLGPDLMYLVTDEVPEHYWKELAEQRQEALEETLRENESLYDQLTVLQVENEKLSSVVETARGLASFLMENLEDDDCPLSKEDLSIFLGSEGLASSSQ